MSFVNCRMDERLLSYLYYFNCKSDYYECHEHGEALWLDSGRPVVLKGLIQAAVCLYHLYNGNVKGGYTMWLRAKGYLAPSLPHYEGIDLERLTRDLDAVFKLVPAEWSSRVLQAHEIAALHLPAVRVHFVDEKIAALVENYQPQRGVEMREQIMESLKDMEDIELAQVLRLIAAKKMTCHKPLAFLQAVMQFEPVPAEQGAFAYEMTIGDDLRNRYGIVHGGVITTFIDTAMAESAFALDGELQKAVTLHLTVNFVKAAQDGKLRCLITPEQNSYRIALFQAMVRDDANDVVATATGHFYKSGHKPQTASL